MTDGFNGIRLPPITVRRSKGWYRTGLLFIGPIVFLAMIFSWSADSDSAVRIRVVQASGAVVVLLIIETVIATSVQQRRQRKFTSGLPVGGLFIGEGSLYPSKEHQGKPNSGTVLIDTEGLHFAAKSEQESIEMSWSNITYIDLGPAAGKVGIGMLTLSLRDGGERRLSILGFRHLADILMRHS